MSTRWESLAVHLIHEELLASGLRTALFLLAEGMGGSAAWLFAMLALQVVIGQLTDLSATSCKKNSCCGLPH